MMATILLGVIGMPEWVLIIAVVLLIFGGRKIPELMRGMGQGIREFKDGMNGNTADKKEEEKTEKK